MLINFNNRAVERSAQEVVQYVKEGNWLGASAPDYACTHGFAMSQAQWDAVQAEAEEIYPNLWGHAQDNWEKIE